MKNWHNLLKNKVFVSIDLPRIVEIEIYNIKKQEFIVGIIKEKNHVSSFRRL